MTRTLGACFSRETPARSAAVYVHQLQKNATIRGSQAFVSGFITGLACCHLRWYRFSRPKQSFDFAEDLLVLEQVLPDGARRAGGHAGAAALAERLVDRRPSLVLVEA